MTQMIRIPRHLQLDCHMTTGHSQANHSSGLIYKQELPSSMAAESPGGTMQDQARFNARHVTRRPGSMAKELIGSKKEGKKKLADLSSEVESGRGEVKSKEKKDQKENVALPKKSPQPENLSPSADRGVEIFDGDQELMNHHVNSIENALSQVPKETLVQFFQDNEAINSITELNPKFDDLIYMDLPDEFREQLDENNLENPIIAKRLVAALQVHLGFSTEEVDGKFGQATKAAFRRYCHYHLEIELTEAELEQTIADQFYRGNTEKMNEDRALIDQAMIDVGSKEVWETFLIKTVNDTSDTGKTNLAWAKFIAKHAEPNDGNSHPSSKLVQRRWVAALQQIINVPVNGRFDPSTKKVLIEWYNDMWNDQLNYDEKSDKMLTREGIIIQSFNGAINKACKAIGIKFTPDKEAIKKAISTLVERASEFDFKKPLEWQEAIKLAKLSEEDNRALGFAILTTYRDQLDQYRVAYLNFLDRTIGKNKRVSSVDDKILSEWLDDIMEASQMTKTVKSNLGEWTMNDWYVGMKGAGMTDQEIEDVGMRIDLEFSERAKEASNKMIDARVSYMNTLDKAATDVGMTIVLPSDDKKFKEVYQRIIGQVPEFDQNDIIEWAQVMRKAGIPEVDRNAIGMTEELFEKAKRRKKARRIAEKTIITFEKEEFARFNGTDFKDEASEINLDLLKVKNDPDIWWNDLEDIPVLEEALEEYKIKYEEWQNASKDDTLGPEKKMEESYDNLKIAVEVYIRERRKVPREMVNIYKKKVLAMVEGRDFPKGVDLSNFKKETDAVHPSGQITPAVKGLFDKDIPILYDLFDEFLEPGADVKRAIDSYQDLLPYIKGVSNEQKELNAIDLIREAGGIDKVNTFILFQNIKIFAKEHAKLIYKIDLERLQSIEDIKNRPLNHVLYNYNKSQELKPNDSERHMNSHLKRGLRYQRQAKYKDAANEFKQVLKEDKKNVEAHIALGRILLRQYKYNEAEPIYRNLLKLKPDLYYAHFYLGDCLAGLKKTQEAIAAYQKFIAAATAEKDIGLAALTIRKIESLKNQLDPNSKPMNSAVEQSREIEQGQENSEKSNEEIIQDLIRKSDEYYDKDQYNRALSSYKEVLKSDPKNELALRGIAWSFYHLSKEEEASKIFQEWLTKDPMNLEARRGKAWSLYHLDKEKEAVNIFRDLTENHKENLSESDYLDVLRGMAWCLYSLGKEKEAVNIFRDLTENHKENLSESDYLDVLRGMAWCLYNLGKEADALRIFENILNIDQKNLDALEGKIKCLYVLEKYQKILNEVKGLEFGKVTPEKIEILTGKGWALYELGSYQEAIKLFEEILEHDNKNTDALNGTGWALIKLGDYQEAFDVMETESAKEISDDDSYEIRGLALKNLGRNDEAIKAFQKAFELYKDDVDPLIEIGKIHLESDELNKARESFERALTVDKNNKDAKKGIEDIKKALNDSEEK